MRQVRASALSAGMYAAASVIGAIAFLYPFWLTEVQQTAFMGMAHANDAPLMTTILVGACLAAMIVEAQGQAMSAKLIALLGVLIAINSVLRFIETALPGPGGFTPIFFLIILTGYVFGARFGYLMGALTLLVSALITGGVGPWLPYQMFTAGWMGMSAGWLGHLRVQISDVGLPGLPASDQSTIQNRASRIELLVLVGFGLMWGFLYGAIMNVWFWPFAVGPAQQYWTPGVGALETLQRYAAFYVATSLAWDVFGAGGTVMLMVLFGAPTLRALRRFQRRFAFNYRPHGGSEAHPDARAEGLTHVAR